MSAAMTDMMMMVMMLGGAYVVGVYAGVVPDVFNLGITPISSPGGGGGGGGPISSSGSCVGTKLVRDTGNNREEFESHNIPGNPSSYEVTWCGTIGSEGQDMTMKMYGPRHQGSNCCWCVLHVYKSGKMVAGGEGKHPHDNCGGPSGNAGPAPCYKGVMRPGPIMEGYALKGGQWKLVVRKKGPCGCKQNSSKKTGNTVMVRNDGKMTTKCVSVNPLGGRAPTQSATVEVNRFEGKIAIA